MAVEFKSVPMFGYKVLACLLFLVELLLFLSFSSFLLAVIRATSPDQLPSAPTSYSLTINGTEYPFFQGISEKSDKLISMGILGCQVLIPFFGMLCICFSWKCTSWKDWKLATRCLIGGQVMFMAFSVFGTPFKYYMPSSFILGTITYNIVAVILMAACRHIYLAKYY